MAGGRYMFEGLNQAGASFAQAIEQKKQNEQLDRKLSGILKLMYPEEDLTGLTLEDKQARFEAETLKGAKAIEQKKLQQMEAQIAQANAATAASQAQVGIAQENQRYLNHQRDMAAEQQAAEAAYLKRYADVAGSQAPGLMNNQAYSRYRETQQNPNLGAGARYMAQTGQVPSGDTMSRYAMPQAAEDLFTPRKMVLDGTEVIQTGPKTAQVVRPPNTTTPADMQMIAQIQKELGVSYGEALVLYSRMRGGMLSNSQLPNGIETRAQSAGQGTTGAPPLPQY